MEQTYEPKNIAIAGAGGIGSWVTHFLFEYGFNRKQFDYAGLNIDVFDDDTIDNKNLLHQNFKLDDLGKYKVEVLEDKYVINPQKKFMEEKFFKKYDTIFCCVDSMEFRKTLYEWSWERDKKNTFWIDGRCESTNGILLNADVPQRDLQKFLSEDKERAGCLLQYEKDNNISHALPVIIASSMVQLFLNRLRGRTITREKLFFL